MIEGELQRVLGSNLRAYRTERRLSQEALADILKVHRTYVGAIERGDRNLSLRSVERLAERLRMDPRALLAAPEGGESPRSPSSGAQLPSSTETGRPRRRRAG